MIDRTGIRGLCNSASYARGLDIYRSNEKVSEFTVQEKDKEDFVRATVKGSGKNSYSVEFKYNKEKDCLDSICCGCPAFYSYDGICKHCVAVLLEYADYESRQKAIEEYMQKAQRQAEAERQKRNKNGTSTKGLPPGSRDKIINIPHPICQAPSVSGKETAAGVKLLLNKQYLRRTAPLMERGTFGKVRVEPFLTGSGRHVQVEFRIGAERMYVVKDVFGFADNMREGRDFSYGQKLRFVHMQEAFAQDSRGLVRFILDWTARNRNRYIQQVYRGYSYSGTNPKLRVLPLTGSELEDFLEAVGEQEFTAQIEGGGERSWRLSDERPRRKLTIIGLEDGIEVRADGMYGIQGTKYHIYFDQGLVYRVPKENQALAEDFTDCLEYLPGNRAFIQKSDIPAFGRELLPALEEHFTCTKENFDEEKYGILKARYEIYLDAPQKDLITCRAMVAYEDKKFFLFDEIQSRELRDMPGEMEVADLLAGYFNAFDEERKELALSKDEEKLYGLLTQGIPRMQEYGEVYISEALKRMRVVETPKVKLGVSLSAGLLDLDLTVEDMGREELLDILSRYNRKKKYFRLKNGSFLNMEDEQIQALLELKEGLRLTSRQLKQDKIQLPGYRAMYLDTQLKDSQVLFAAKDKNFRALIRNMKTVEDNDFEVPKEQEGILREYQKKGFLWMKTLKQNGFGGILADDMGLGKTLQVITFLWSEFLEAEEGEERRGLIITPASLVFNWGSEIERFAPELPVKMIVGTAAEREALIQGSGGQEILVTSYELLRRDIEQYKKMTFACQVIDEAQYIKNHGTQSAKAVKSVRAGFKMALTGTPVENRLSELWSIFDYLMPGFLYTYEQFRKEIEQPMVHGGDERAKERLQKMIRPFVLRRLKRDVLKDLPDKIEKDMFAKLDGEQRQLYDAHVKRLQMVLSKQTEEEFKTSKIQILAEITKLRQICCHPGLLYEDYAGSSSKLEMCLELIEDAVNGGHKILLFSQFTSMLELILQRLKEEEISYYSLTGATPKEQRNELVNAFNQDDTSVFCISLRAGGTGLNLTAADIVIHYDPWWNLAVQNQATDRAHRIGQKNVVSVYKLFVKGTIEEKIKKLQEKKMELADQILSGEGLESSRMSKEELLELLQASR